MSVGSPLPCLIGDKDMTETLAEKICAPCRGGIPPLTREAIALERPLAGEFGFLTLVQLFRWP